MFPIFPFGVEVLAVSKYLKNIFESRELVADSVISILETTAADGKTYKTQYYNLDAIIAVGYRQPVNSSLKISAMILYYLRARVF